MFIEPSARRRPPSAPRKRRNSTRSQGTTDGQIMSSFPNLSVAESFETELVAVDTKSWSSDEGDEYLDKDAVYRILDGDHLTWRRRFEDIFDGAPHARDTNLHIAINVVSILAIVVSCTTFSIMTLPQNLDARNGAGIDYSGALFIIDAACISFFVTEIGVRIWARKSWAKLVDVFFAIDIVTILGFVIDIMIDEFSSNQGGVALVRLLRLFRVFRVFKLSRHSKSLQLVVVVLKKSAAGLTVLTLPLLIVTLVFSSVIYFFEVLAATWDADKRVWMKSDNRPAQFQSIPDAIWFTASTVTTVGYGDIVPVTVPGKIVAVLASFFGILILSFPNIVLGGNLQFAFRSFNQHRARRMLGKKFRKVYFMVSFVNEMKRMVERRSSLNVFESPLDAESGGQVHVSVGDFGDGVRPSFSSPGEKPSDNIRVGKLNAHVLSSVTRQDTLKRNQTNFIGTKAELEYYRQEGVACITDQTVRDWSFHHLRAVTVMQRLLELCSGVGTVQEIHDSFVLAGEQVRSTDIALVALYLLEAEFLQVFVFRRGATNMLLSLTQKACQELLVHAEEGAVHCTRSIDVARILWKRTTNIQPQYSLHLLIPSYRIWAATEKLVDNKEHTPNTDAKITFWKVPDRSPSTLAASGKHQPYVAVAVSDAKVTLAQVVEKQRLRIAGLESLLIGAAQDRTNGFGL